MKKSTLTFGRRSVSIYTPLHFTECPIVYTLLPTTTAESMDVGLCDMKVVLADLSGVDWDSDLSPWSAPSAFKGGKDYTGGANDYLLELTGNIVPSVEAILGFSPSYRAIAGYSLAGLFAIYALYHTDIFNRAASISGSLWYDGFLDFMKNNRPLRLPERVYFSLGDREKITKNQRLATVEYCTMEAEKLMQSLGCETIFELNPGNHFTDIAERVEKGLRWIIA